MAASRRRRRFAARGAAAAAEVQAGPLGLATRQSHLLEVQAAAAAAAEVLLVRLALAHCCRRPAPVLRPLQQRQRQLEVQAAPLRRHHLLFTEHLRAIEVIGYTFGLETAAT